MTIHKIVTQNKSNNHAIAMRDFAGLKFTILRMFLVGTFFMVLLEKICDLQEQLRSVQQEIRLLIFEQMARLSIEIVFDCVDQSETESEIKAL